MSSYKEIVTKTVIGKGKKTFNNRYSIDVNDNISTILGCWVINHKFNGNMENNIFLLLYLPSETSLDTPLEKPN